MSFQVQPMSITDVVFCREQAAREGWNPGLYDMEVFYKTDPDGWFKAVDDRGQIMGCISAVAYDETFGFIGFFVVLPVYRGGRVGIELGRRALEYLGDRIIGQDGVFAKVANYETWGFVYCYRNLRYEWQSDCGLFARSNIQTAAYDVSMQSAVLEYDRHLFPCSRAGFLTEWLAMKGALVRTAWSGSQLVGYGLRRPCVAGYKIGPLFSDTQDIAMSLFASLVDAVPACTPVYLDVPEKNASAIAMVGSLGMRQCFGTARMYKNGIPELDIPRIFGVSSFELG